MTQGKTDENTKESVISINEIRELKENEPTKKGNIYAWNQKGGVTASSTRNMTGVYDLSGGLWERTASYVANGNDNLLTYGSSVTYTNNILKENSTKYTTIYPHDSNIDNDTKLNTEENLNIASNANYVKNTKIYGDAVREVSERGTEDSSWEKDYSAYVSLYSPFVTRGGVFWDNIHAGRFYFGRSNGDSRYYIGFRPVVVPVS